MRIDVNGATDTASMVLFWPELLPEDVETELQKDPIGLVEKLHAGQRLISFPCDSDGDYWLSIFVRSEIPANLMRFCREEAAYRHFHVPGSGFFGGSEYLSKDGFDCENPCSHMHQRANVPSGVYSAKVYTVDTPEEYYDNWLAKRVGSASIRIWNFHSNIAAWSVLSVLVSIAAFFFLSWFAWWCVVAVTGLLTLFCLMLSRTPAYIAVKIAQDKFAQEYPSYVLVLE